MSEKSHVFVVDDDVHVRALICDVLTTGGYTTHQYASADEVETALTQWAPSLIILDLSLADSDAIEVIHSLARARFAGSVLLLSGHDAATLEDVRSIGLAHDVNMLPALRKPFRVEDLREAANVASRRPEERQDASLEAALENNWLQLWYQPKINLQNSTLCGAEGLIRLAHPTEGILSPQHFLPPPGDPLYVPLTDYVVRRALADWAALSARGLKDRLAINIPASVLQRPDFVASLRKHLPKAPDFPGLIVEITEDEAIRDPELAREIAVQLKLYKVGVSIDDFGAGYSTLTRFSELSFSEIKLDRSFVQGCSCDDRKREMCTAVAQLAKRFGISSVAEGIENRDDLKVVTELGYDVGQGFLFARPMPLADFERTLATRSAS